MSEVPCLHCEIAMLIKEHLEKHRDESQSPLSAIAKVAADIIMMAEDDYRPVEVTLFIAQFMAFTRAMREAEAHGAPVAKSTVQ